MSEILPCSNCGGEAKLNEVKWDNWIECTQCHWKGANVDTAEEAIKLWNIANIKHHCPHCESPYSDERDENGLPYCTCDGAEMEKLTRENETLKIMNAELEQVAGDSNSLIKAINTFTAELRSTNVIEKFARENAELKAEIAILQTKVARQARAIEMLIAHVPEYLIPTLIAREDAES